jgi:hypothetical protein
MWFIVDSFIESNDENIDLNIGNLMRANNNYCWVDKEIFGNVKKIPKETIRFRNLIVSLTLILQTNCSMESKEIFLNNILEELRDELTDIDFKKYLDFEYALQSATRVLDYNQFTDNQSDFYHNLRKENFSHVLEAFKSFDSIYVMSELRKLNSSAMSEIDILNDDVVEIQNQKSKILASYTWKFGRFFNLFITNPILLSRLLIKSIRNFFI